MAPFTWPIDHHAAISAFEQRSNPDAGALLHWAARSVDALHYLADLDQGCYSNPGFAGHSHDTIDVAHARWATGSCVTALDLVAASLGRAKCGNTKAHELDLRDFDPKRPGAANRRSALPRVAVAWIDATLADTDVQMLEKARHALVHSRVLRHFVMIAGGPHVRLRLEVDGVRIPAEQLVEMAVRCATTRIVDFFQRLPLI